LISLLKQFFKVRIINFMMIGGIAFIVSIAVYYPLTLFFQYNVMWLGQIFYLPAAIPSTFVSLIFGYYGNRKWTFGDCRAKRLSLLMYVSTGMLTAVGDIFLLFVIVHLCRIHYLVASILAVIVMFVVRYIISRKWIWKQNVDKD
jgi:putative flippase GtrA